MLKTAKPEEGQQGVSGPKTWVGVLNIYQSTERKEDAETEQQSAQRKSGI